MTVKSTSACGWSPGPSAACFFVFSTTRAPQLLRPVEVGAMKSFSAAVNESEDRLFRYALPNATQPVPPSASKSTVASPKVRAEMGPSPSDSAFGMAVVLIDPVA